MIQDHIRQQAIELGCDVLVPSTFLGMLAAKWHDTDTAGNLMLFKVYVHHHGVWLWLSAKVRLSPPYIAISTGGHHEIEPDRATGEEE